MPCGKKEHRKSKMIIDFKISLVALFVTVSASEPVPEFFMTSINAGHGQGNGYGNMSIGKAGSSLRASQIQCARH